MKYSWHLFIILFLLSGCRSVEFVRKDLSPQKQAVIRYPVSSNLKKNTQYRDDLRKQATSFCNGAFDITKEYQALDKTGTSTGVGTGVGVGMGGFVVGGSTENTDMYNFVELTCL